MTIIEGCFIVLALCGLIGVYALVRIAEGLQSIFAELVRIAEAFDSIDVIAVGDDDEEDEILPSERS